MKNFNWNNKIVISCLALLFLLFSAPAYSQETEESEDDKRPVRSPYESALLMNNQSVIVPSTKTLEFDMMHRFGSVENGISDLYGLYAQGADIRLGFTYTLIDDLALGFGFAKQNKYVDFSAKYALLKQTRDWSMPISVTYYGNLSIDAKDTLNAIEYFETNVQRISYLNEVIIATKISPKLTLQLTPTYSHFNAVDTLMSNDIFAIGAGGRYKFTPQSSVVFNYTQQITLHDDFDSDPTRSLDLQPDISVGLEIATSAHAFQIFVSTFQSTNQQFNIVNNENKFSNKRLDADGNSEKKLGFLIGFNITRLWNF